MSIFNYTSKEVQSSLPIEIIVKAFVLIMGHPKKEGTGQIFLGWGKGSRKEMTKS